MTDTKTHQPDALMFLATGCAHCPSVLQHLGELLKTGEIGRLEVINIGNHPEQVQTYNVRSVPWVKIGPFELIGLHSKSELQHWIQQASSTDGMANYFSGLLNNGELQQVIDMLHKQPDYLPVLLDMMQQRDIQISVQIGIGAIMEDFAGSEALQKLIPTLTTLIHHTLPRVRNDACHYLSLTGDASVIPTIKILLDDDDPEVRESARDSLDDMNAGK